MNRADAAAYPVSSLQGIGPRRARVLASQGLRSVLDLCEYVPRRYLDRSRVCRIAELVDGEQVTVAGKVTRIDQAGPGNRKSMFRAWLGDGSGELELVWFRGASYLGALLRPGSFLAVHGKVGFFGRRPQMRHPDFDRLQNPSGRSAENDLLKTGRIIPLYPLTDAMKKAGIGSWQLQRMIQNAIEAYGTPSEEVLSRGILLRHQLMPIGEAYRQLHLPSSPGQLERALHRFRWNELFYAQLYFARRYHALKSERNAVVFERSGEKTAELYRMLPFDLTGAQKRAVREIYRDLRSGSPMNRLLQGDVGSGKTLVALFAMALASDNGVQAAMMVPTEILAFQHWMSIRNYAGQVGLRVALLTGRQGARERRKVLEEVESGTIDIVVGTHAVIQDQVRFRRLGLAVIDEQHRFGVLQRKALQDKSDAAHVLLMTATPIPRTLAMGAFGDLDVTVLDELPGGRKRIVTRLCREEERGSVYDAVLKEVRAGRQAYVVYPLVDESEKMDLKAAVDSCRQLASGVFRDRRVGLVHGQMSGEEKEAVMDGFRNGSIDILVGTTVIEVGVDVPDATVMVIEHAERFGLAQLHQLRGRVGRGCHQSWCFLLYQGRLSGDAASRLQAMERTADGFRLSEIDAEIRGAGNVLGREQSGMVSGFRFADPARDYTLMQAAREAAFRLVEEDPQLQHEENRVVRTYFRDYFQQHFSLAGIG